jgi:tRNA-dihydrouridine synthase C
VQLHHWIIDYYAQLLMRLEPKHAPGLLKKWLGMMRTAYPEAETLHRRLRTERDPSVIGKILAAYQI